MTSTDTASCLTPAHRPLPRSECLWVLTSGTWQRRILSGQIDFFEKIGRAVQQHGIAPLVVDIEDPLYHKIARDDERQKIIIGPFSTARMAGRAHFANPGYVWGFWYLDPLGVHWRSSLYHQQFEPEQVNEAEATYFFNGVSSYMIAHNVSQRTQEAGSVALAPASAVIFLQDIEGYLTPAHYLTTRDIIETTAAECSGLVYVKPHPLMNERARRAIQECCAPFANVRVVDASLHRLITASDVIISQNSSAGFEALMHRKPVLTCGQSDYHHATLVCQRRGELAANISQAQDHFRSFPYEKYFYWFLGQNLFEPAKDDFPERALMRIYGERFT